jgi:tetratricopeptide (TPR) repeat protein
MNSSS